MRQKLPLVLSVTALAVALLGTVPLADAHGVFHTMFAHNSDRVDGRHAVGALATTDRRKGKLVATSRRTGLLPNNIIAKAPRSGQADNADTLDGLDSSHFASRAAFWVISMKASGALVEPSNVAGWASTNRV
jgi:hypothetical protein